MAKPAFRSKAVVLLLLKYCLMYFPSFVGFLCLYLFLLCITLCPFCKFCNNLKRKRKLVALLLLSYRCIVTITVLWLFIMAPPWVGLQCVIVVFPDHTHLLFYFIVLLRRLVDTYGSCLRRIRRRPRCHTLCLRSITFK